LAVLLVDRFVALTGAFAQTFNIKNLNFAAGVLDQPGFLKKCAQPQSRSCAGHQAFQPKILA
jgi:hypothetical protein